jgi:type I restriction enzyme S subunit
MRNWGKYKLGDIASIKGGKRIPKGEILTNEKNTHPYIRITDMSGRYVPTEDLMFVPDIVFPHIKKYIVNDGDIILSIVGTIGLVAIIGQDLDNASLTENCVKVRPFNKSLNTKFLYYFLISPNGQAEIKKCIVGSTQPKLPLYKIDIPVVSEDEQSRIVSILSSLDDKIELNIRMNMTLEAIAQAIFKEWFVDFKFPGSDGELVDGLPKGWRNGHLIDILDLHYGKALKSEDRKVGRYPVLGSSGVVGFHNAYYVEGPGIVIGRKGTIGKVIWVDQDFFPIDTTFFVKDSLGTSFLYYHFFLMHSQSFQRISSDSAVPGLNKNEALRNKVIVPNVQIINRFNEFAKPLFERMNLINIENQTLTMIRDTLLPKLMTGKIRVA